MKQIISRGFNYQGQLGLGKGIRYVMDKFILIPNFKNKIISIDTNLAHNFALLEGILK